MAWGHEPTFLHIRHSLVLNVSTTWPLCKNVFGSCSQSSKHQNSVAEHISVFIEMTGHFIEVSGGALVRLAAGGKSYTGHFRFFEIC